MTDDQLVALAKMGDPDALEALLERHYDFACHLLLADSAAELTADQVRRILGRALCRLHFFDPSVEPFVEWLAHTLAREAERHTRPAGRRSRTRREPDARLGPALEDVAAAGAAVDPAPAALRSEMPAIRRRAYRVAAPFFLGLFLATPLVYSFFVRVDDEGLGAWIGHPLFRAGLALGFLWYAVWFSSRLSRLLEWVELDGLVLRWKPLCSSRIREESLCSLKGIWEDGTIEFLDGRTILLDDHPREPRGAIAGRLQWWLAHGMRLPAP